jgi:tight adherence protein C
MDTLVLLGGLVAIFLGVGLAAGMLLVGHRETAVERGITTIGQSYGAGPPGSGPGSRPGTGAWPGTSGGVAGTVGRVLTPRRAANWIERQLDYAGNPPLWPPSRVNETQGIGALVVGALGVVIGLVGGGLLGGLIGLVLGLAAGLSLPLIIVSDLATRRQEKLRRDLPDALDLLTLSVEAGQGFDAALALVSGRMAGPLSREIARALQEMQMGMRRTDAIRGMGARTNVVELRSFCTAVVQAGDLGIPIANVLREQAVEMRLKRRQRADEQARKVPVKIVIPLTLLLLPAIFIVVLGPAVLTVMKVGLFQH